MLTECHGHSHKTLSNRGSRLLETVVLLFPGQEFTTVGVKRFEKTDFQDVVSGVYSILVVSASGTSLTDVHLFCRQACHQDACCDGFILSQLILDGGNGLGYSYG